MYEDNCLNCDGFLKEVVYRLEIEGIEYPFCSETCIEEWNDLSNEDRIHYLHCVQCIYALRGE